MATITDVCKLAGVSKATVSRVINGNPQVKDKTRQIVLDAMTDLGYKPNVMAQALATNSSNYIGLILPHFHSHYFGSVLKQTAQDIQKANKKLFVMDSHNNAEGEREAIRSLTVQRCNAIIIYSRHLSEPELEDIQREIQIPLLILNRSLSSQNLFSLGFDQFQLGTIAVNHLISLGHSHIACITTPLDSDTGRTRLAAYKQCLSDHHLPLNEHLIIEGKSDLKSGYHAAQRLLKTRDSLTAIFCCNDDMALGALRAIHELGLSVPNDISLIGIDNEPCAQYTIPSISTVALPITTLTHDAISLALKLAARENCQPQHFDYQGELIVRESTQSLS